MKSLHLQVKKTQAGQEKLKEEVDSDKDILISLQQTLEQTTKKMQVDRLKLVTQTELESSLKQAEHRTSQQLVMVV